MFTKRHASTTIVILALALASAVLADDFTISRSTVDGGGVMFSTDGQPDGFELSGTIGQPDAGAMSGDDFTLTGGFWFALAPGDCNVDGGVNLFDYDVFEACLNSSGPAGGILGPDCVCYDLDQNGTVDLLDVAELQRNLSGSEGLQAGWGP